MRARIKGTAAKPRISVFRSNRYIFVQAIDDVARLTIVQSSSLGFKDDRKGSAKVNKTEEAKKVGRELAKRLLKKNVKMGVFDRGAYSYKGRVRALVEGLREEGIKI